MAELELVLPLVRRSPVRLPQRELVLPAGDGWRLMLRLVGRDASDGEALDGCYGVPPLRLTVFRLEAGGCEYGRVTGSSPDAVWRGWASPAGEARAAVLVPEDVTAAWQGRYGFCVQAAGDHAVTTLLRGTLQVLPGLVLRVFLDSILDDAAAPILNDNQLPIQVKHAPID